MLIKKRIWLVLIASFFIFIVSGFLLSPLSIFLSGKLIQKYTFSPFESSHLRYLLSVSIPIAIPLGISFLLSGFFIGIMLKETYKKIALVFAGLNISIGYVLYIIGVLLCGIGKLPFSGIMSVLLLIPAFVAIVSAATTIIGALLGRYISDIIRLYKKY